MRSMLIITITLLVILLIHLSPIKNREVYWRYVNLIVALALVALMVVLYIFPCGGC